MKSNQTEKKLPVPDLPNKLTAEVAWQGVPLTLEVDPDSPKEAPMFLTKSIAASATGSKMARSTPSVWASATIRTVTERSQGIPPLFA